MALRRVGLALLGLGALACSRAPQGRVLTVYAAASLADGFRSVGAELQRRTPGLRVEFAFAGSQQLALQIQQGARADVFASADPQWMVWARKRGLVDSSVVFAGNRLVVVTPARDSAVRTLADLGRPGVKVVLAAPEVPAGRYARRALEALGHAPGLDTGFAARVERNVVSQEDNVKAVLAKVQLDEADAGIVYHSDVAPTVAPRVRTLAIPAEFNQVARYPIAVTRRTRLPADARAFVELVLSPAGQALLVRAGLEPPPAR